jgi:hypothetical protein
MKKLFSVFAVLALCFALRADTWTAQTMYDAVVDWGGVVVEISDANAYCTLTTSNTKTIVSGTKLDAGWRYVLSHDTLTGSSAATAVVEIVVACLDKDGNTMETKIVDSIVGSSEQYGGSHDIPFFTEMPGTGKFKLILQGDTGAETIFNRLYLYKYRPVVWQKQWK